MTIKESFNQDKNDHEAQLYPRNGTGGLKKEKNVVNLNLIRLLSWIVENKLIKRPIFPVQFVASKIETTPCELKQ